MIEDPTVAAVYAGYEDGRFMHLSRDLRRPLASENSGE